MSAPTIVLLFESRLFFTTKGIVIVFRRRKTLARLRVIILRTVFLSTRPAPRTTTAIPNMKFILVVEATCKDIRTRIVF